MYFFKTNRYTHLYIFLQQTEKQTFYIFCYYVTFFPLVEWKKHENIKFYVNFVHPKGLLFF